MNAPIVSQNRHLFAPDHAFAQFTTSKTPEIVEVCSQWDDGAGMPQGYTYLGQFLAHDIASRDRPGSPASKRSWKLDLDSVYGGGAELDHFGRFIYCPESPSFASDLLRDPQTKIARIPEFRNDEHPIISHLHLTIQLFHNEALRRIQISAKGGGLSASQQFAMAKKYVTATVQRIYAEDYLAKCSDSIIHSMFKEGSLNVFEIPASETDLPFEISHATLRFGHSQVRANYLLNGREEHTELLDLFLLSGLFGRNAYKGIPKNKAIDWRRFFPWEGNDCGIESDLGQRINPKVVKPMSELLEAPIPDIVVRNIEAGARVDLPSGQVIATRLQAMGIDKRISPLLKAQERNQDQERLLRNSGLWDSTPLWLFILIEAANADDGKHLGPLGSVFLCETIRNAINVPDRYDSVQLTCTRAFELPQIATFVQLVKFTEPDIYDHPVDFSGL